MKRSLHLVVAGGGTAGHLFPGLAVATALRAGAPGLRITFAGGGKDLERRLVAAASFDYYPLPCRPLPHGAREAVSFVVENLAGYLAAKRFLKEEQVGAVVGLGGYASVSMGRAAVRRRIPLVLLEQNVAPGRATRWLAPAATLLCASFPQTESFLRRCGPLRVTGNPIRPLGTVPFAAPADEANGPARRLLVLGGSGGARALNENVPRAIYKAGAELAGWQILHQAGEAELAATRRLYEKLGLRAVVRGFMADLPAVLSAADLAICRAGGTTLAELAAAGVPAVLIPYPHAADDHQRKNAEVFVAAGGAVLLDEREGPPRLDDRLAAVLAALAPRQQRRSAMAAAMRGLGRPQAAADVAALVWSLLSSQACRSRVAA
jgi:UDP-N-acetylglucosamine--N-acetylmuramyl-(pentapeptide) pyrophosphoryl-undecaprenol N-acetylglucosamine transferase